jgi:hypothetical protein
MYFLVYLRLDPEDGGSAFLWNIGKRLPEYTVYIPENSVLHSHYDEPHIRIKTGVWEKI